MGLRERYIGTYVSAESASNYIDANGIISAANSIISELEEFSNLANDVSNAGADLNASNLSIDGSDFSPKVEELVTAIRTQHGTMTGDLEGIIAKAESVYNDKQDQLNADAKARDEAAAEAARIAAMKSRSN